MTIRFYPLQKKEIIALVFLLVASVLAFFSFHTQVVSRSTTLTSTVSLVVQNLSLYETAPITFTYLLSQNDEVLFSEERVVDAVLEPAEAIPGTNRHTLSVSHVFYVSEEAARGWYTFTVLAQQPHETVGSEVAKTEVFVAPSLLSFPFFRFGMYVFLLLSFLLFVLALRERFRRGVVEKIVSQITVNHMNRFFRKLVHRFHPNMGGFWRLLFLFLVIPFAILANSSIEPVWLWRWILVSELLYIGIAVALIHPLYLAYLLFICRKDWTAVFKVKQRNRTKGTKYTHFSFLAFFIFFVGPIVIFPITLSLTTDTVASLLYGSQVQEKRIVVWDNSSVSGTFFFGQSIETTDREGFLLLFSFDLLDGAQKEYTIRYLPRSRMILDSEAVPREEDSLSVLTPFSQLPSKEEVAALEASLAAVLQRTGVGYIEKSIQPLLYDGFHSDEYYRITDRSLADKRDLGKLFSSLTIKGVDADVIYTTILPTLQQYPFLKGSRIQILYRDVEREDLYGWDTITLE